MQNESDIDDCEKPYLYERPDLQENIDAAYDSILANELEIDWQLIKYIAMFPIDKFIGVINYLKNNHIKEYYIEDLYERLCKKGFTDKVMNIMSLFAFLSNERIYVISRACNKGHFELVKYLFSHTDAKPTDHTVHEYEEHYQYYYLYDSLESLNLDLIKWIYDEILESKLFLLSHYLYGLFVYNDLSKRAGESGVIEVYKWLHQELINWNQPVYPTRASMIVGPHSLDVLEWLKSMDLFDANVAFEQYCVHGNLVGAQYIFSTEIINKSTISLAIISAKKYEKYYANCNTIEWLESLLDSLSSSDKDFPEVKSL